MSVLRSGKMYKMEEMPAVSTNSGSSSHQSIKNLNSYLTKKTLTQGLLDIALFTHNVSQLKYVMSLGPDGPNAHPFYHLMMTLVSLSIILQTSVGLCLILLGKTTVNDNQNQRRAEMLNDAITIQIFLISILNILISSFGIEESVQRSRKIDEWTNTNDEYFQKCPCLNSTRLFLTRQNCW